jgi:tetratricopeptide (TPR) repeat protein
MHYDTTVDTPPALVGRIRYDHNNTVIHSKGPAIINALDVVLGRLEFERIYKKALRVYGGKRLGWREFQRFCEAETGRSLEWFFDAWVRSNDYLCYAVESRESRPEGDGYRTEIRVRKLGTMAMPVPVKAVFEDGTEQVATTDWTKVVDVLIFTSRTKLKEAVLDPEKKLAMAARPLPAISPAAAALVGYGWAAQDAPKIFEALRSQPVASPDLWYRLGTELYGANRTADALFCFEKVAGLASDPLTAFAAQGWLGLLEDLRGRRAAALEHYRQALRLDVGKSMSHGRLQIEINRAWVEERLKTPFTRPGK